MSPEDIESKALGASSSAEEDSSTAEAAPKAIESPAPAAAETSPAEADTAATPAPEAEARAAEESAPAAEAESTPEEGSAPVSERPEVLALRKAKDEQTEVEGRVIGWNRGGFHVVIGDITAFCPRSEMELGHPRSPKEYLDKTLGFQVLKVQKRGKRVVLSRTAVIKGERSKVRAEVRGSIEAGSSLQGRIASLTDFGAFVDLGGGVQGLVHISEISHQRVERPQDVLQVDQEVTVKVLNVEKGGKRISLSLRALESNPWSDIKNRYPEGTVLKGRVQKTTKHGALVELEPGLTGLLPTSVMSLPRDASVARAFPPGRELTIQIVAVDDRRHRISLAPEGSTLEGTWRDFQSYRKGQDDDEGQGFHALANALKKARIEAD